MKQLLSIIAVLTLAALPLLAQSTTTQTFTNPYYTSVVVENGTFQNGEFDFIHYENGVAHFYKFFAYAPSNLNNYQPQLEVTEDGKAILPLTDGTWTDSKPTYTFSAGTLPSAEIGFTLQATRCCGFKAVNVTATLTRSGEVVVRQP